MVNWTEKRIAKLKLLHKEGLSGAAIAKKLGPAFTKGMVIGKLRRLELASKAAKTSRSKKATTAIRDSSSKGALARSAPSPSKRAAAIILPASHARPLTLEVRAEACELVDLRSGQCRFPLGDDRPARLFCGAATVGTSSWCEHHLRVVFPSFTRSDQRHKSPRANDHGSGSHRKTARSPGRPPTDLIQRSPARP
jgi:hypothetical protein